jgi:hypothetical protein
MSLDVMNIFCVEALLGDLIGDLPKDSCGGWWDFRWARRYVVKIIRCWNEPEIARTNAK